MDDSEKCFCTFCGKHQDYVSVVLAAPERKAFICNECIDVAVKVVAEKKEQNQ